MEEEEEEEEAVLLQNWFLLQEAMTSDILNSRYCLFFLVDLV